MNLALLSFLGFVFLIVVLFGVYSAVFILYGVINFPECPKAYEDLLKDLQRARQDLALRGFTNW